MERQRLKRAWLEVSPAFLPPLDPDFLPASLWTRAFKAKIRDAGAPRRVMIALERCKGSVSRYDLEILSPGSSAEAREANLFFIERMVKNLLWMRGARRVSLSGSEEILKTVAKMYSRHGERSFDFGLMSRAYAEPFKVRVVKSKAMPEAAELTRPLGGHFDGYRVGFDLGASDWKVAAVARGEAVYTAEFPWNPAVQPSPRYHYYHLRAALNLAAGHLPRVEAIGGSAAGIYVNNEPRVASLFRGVKESLFAREIGPLFHRLQQEWRVPFEVANDGEVAALAGALSLKVQRLLAISMGSSQAGGYVNARGHLTDWLNELAFVPVDYRLLAPLDEWSGDRGCGVQYFSQQAVFRLAKKAGLTIDESLPAAEKLRQVQARLAAGEDGARKIFETIGVYLGYAIAHYADFYDLGHVLLLGRVTSGEGGSLILDKAQEVLKVEFPDLAERVRLHLPDERSRRFGQAVAAASLPLIRSKKGGFGENRSRLNKKGTVES